MEPRLDMLLDAAREPSPPDEPFVGAVMARVRADAARRRRIARMLTGPAAIAAASLIALGAGIATLVRSTNTPESALHVARPVVPTSEQSTAAPANGTPARPATGTTPEVHRTGDLEWGYTSEASAYAVDHATGLRLETKIATTEFDTNVPQTVTMTLRNTGNHAVAVSSLSGCPLLVSAYPTHGAAAGNREALPWQCASSSARPSSTFVLKPGGQHVGQATVVLPSNGEWSIVGMCRCTSEPATKTPEKTSDPLGGLGELARLATGSPAGAGSERPARSSGLVTPPIRVEAR
ncbi:MAG TPA: hypothetical protein VFA34_04320 [Actinomycetota bacterium]|jgi:hypothetical protein|nr:hypothetical protein [Actinomycetota bacterium]